MCPLRGHCHTDGFVVSGYLSAFLVAASGQQQRIELDKIAGIRQRYPMIAPKVTGFALDAALLVRFFGCAELTLKTPVRAEGDEARGLLAAIAPENLLNRAFQIVVSEDPKHSAEVTECQLVGFEERLLGGALVRAME